MQRRVFIADNLLLSAILIDRRINMSYQNIWKNYIHNYVAEKDLLGFYDKFLGRFEDKWDAFLLNYNFKELCQLNNGNRLRPMLVYWGFLLNRSDDSLFEIDDEKLDYIIDFCVVVEAIHKMSLLIDDWIDGDIARHGSATFHAVYGADVAVLLAMNILLKSVLELSNRLPYALNKDIYQKNISLALRIAYDMTQGALDEVSSSGGIISISKVKEIVSLETSSIIRNGLVMGYIAGLGINDTAIDLLDDVGYCCGYAFQSLNDLEPFGNADALVKHKGALSTDIIKNRKNIVVAHIYAWATKTETNQLEETNNSNQKMYYSVVSLIEKYHIRELILEEVAELQRRINDRIGKIEKLTGHSRWCALFMDFISITLAASKERALGKHSKFL
jgi:heptaprenyl diphosphate synthase